MRAVVTFAARDDIAGRLRDNVWEAARAVLAGHPDRVARERLLDGGPAPFSHVLGRADTGAADLVASAVRAVRRLAEAGGGDPEARVRSAPVTDRIVDALLAALADRFLLIGAGELHRDPASGWPDTWTWGTRNLAEFHRVLALFRTDRPELHGRLLTPLVTTIETTTP